MACWVCLQDDAAVVRNVCACRSAGLHANCLARQLVLTLLQRVQFLGDRLAVLPFGDLGPAAAATVAGPPTGQYIEGLTITPSASSFGRGEA